MNQFRILKKFAYGFILLYLMLSVFNLGLAYGETKEIGEGFLDWVTEENSYKWDRYENPPHSLNVMVEHYNRIHSNLWGALISLFVMYIFDILIDPKNHQINKLWGRLKRLNLE